MAIPLIASKKNARQKKEGESISPSCAMADAKCLHLNMVPISDENAWKDRLSVEKEANTKCHGKTRRVIIADFHSNVVDIRIRSQDAF